MKAKIRLCLALLVAAAFTDVLSATAWRRVWSALALWVGLLRKPDAWASAELAERRLAACRECPVFYRRLETCGSPLHGEWPEAGCWCYMPEAVKVAGKTCWLDENYPDNAAPDGWKAHGVTTG